MKNAILVVCIVVALRLDPVSAAAGVAGFAVGLVTQRLFLRLGYTREAAILAGIVPQNVLLMAVVQTLASTNGAEGLARFAASALLATYGLYQRYVR